MNARTASFALLAALMAAPVFADTGVTRAEVSAEYIRARNAGELDFANEFLSPTVQARKASPSAAAAIKIEQLPATAAGKRDEQPQAVRADKTPG